MPNDATSTLIAGRFAVDTSQRLPDAGGGLTAYPAADRQSIGLKRVAIEVSRDASPRARALTALTDPIDNLMVPIGHGVAPASGGKGESYYIICTAPPGPALSASLAPWPEGALIDLVLRPAARVLDSLQSRGLTHRAIRLNNMFQAAPGQPVTMGAAWAAPPAMHQPAVFESPYQAMCHPAGRGDGSIAEDVYALGVLLIVLSSGRIPLASLDDTALIRWKLDLGSFAALARDASMSGFIADLARGMLAEDPDHRPSPRMLLDPANARGRRVAARPARRSQRPLMWGDIPVFDARTLAFALLRDDKKAVQALRTGMVGQWLRRAMGDAGLASAIEELVRARLADTTYGARSETLLVMHVISTINPRMPLCWRGVALWPDSLASLVANGIASQSMLAPIVEELLVNDVVVDWVTAEHRPSRVDLMTILPEIGAQRQYLQASGPGGLLRVFYVLNPVLPCRAESMAVRWVMSIGDLMAVLEQISGGTADKLIDLDIATFIAARADRQIETGVNRLLAGTDADLVRTGELTLLRDLQLRYHQHPMPGLAKWLVGRLQPDLRQWRNKTRRAEIAAELASLAETGSLARLLAVIQDTASRAADRIGTGQAMAECAAIDAELAVIDQSDRFRLADAEQVGQAMTGAAGLIALILLAMTVLVR